MNQLDGTGLTSTRTRLRMVDMIRLRGIVNEKVLAAMAEVPRHLFVDEALASRAYELVSLPIGYGQTISHPAMVARLAELISSENSLGVALEIGCGCGYQAAVLSYISKEVVTIERNVKLAAAARVRLKKLGYSRVRVKHADGYLGFPELAPFDGILLTAAPPRIPEVLKRQLGENGSLVLPLGAEKQWLHKITRGPGGFDEKVLESVKFVPLVSGLSSGNHD